MAKSKKAQTRVFEEAPVVDVPVECLLGGSDKCDFSDYVVKSKGEFDVQKETVALPAEYKDIVVEEEEEEPVETRRPSQSHDYSVRQAKVPTPAAIHSTPSHTSFHMTNDYINDYDMIHGQPVCGDWRKLGSCKREMCRYVHVDPTKRPPKQHKPAVREVPCRYYAQGNCTKGHQCPFSHSSYGGYGDSSMSSHSPYDSSHMWDSPYHSSMHMGMGMGMNSMSMMNPMTYQAYNGYGGYAPSTPSATHQEEIPPHPDWQGPGWTKGNTTSSTTQRQQEEKPVYKDDGSEMVTKVRTKLAAQETLILSSVILAAFDWSEDDMSMLLGLGTNSIGLTRFKSVLVKRSIRHCREAGHANAIANLIDWEKKLLPWLPEVEGDFAKYFESNLCSRIVEVLRCMAASPSSRFRIPDDSCVEAAKSDPAAVLLTYWQPHSSRLMRNDMLKEWPEADLSCLEPMPADPHAVFTHTSEISWTPSVHSSWPVTFRGRTRALLKATMMRKYMKMDLPLLGSVLSFLPPVCPCDVPHDPENTNFLDIVCAVLAHYSLNALGATEESHSVVKERLGESVWPVILGVFGESCAPKITGMFLQMDPEDLLLDIVNGHRFIESLQEAWKVWENSSQSGRPEEE